MDEAAQFLQSIQGLGPAALMFLVFAGFMILAYKLGIPITRAFVESLKAFEDGWQTLTESQAKHHEKMYEGMQDIMKAQEKRIQELERKVAARDEEITDLKEQLAKVQSESKEEVLELKKRLSKAEIERDRCLKEYNELKEAYKKIEGGKSDEK